MSTTTDLARARAWRCPLSGDIAGTILDRAIAGDQRSADRALTIAAAMSAGDPAAARAYSGAIPMDVPSPVIGAGIMTAPVRPAHRPRLDPTMTRVVRSYRLNPKTIAAIDAEAKRTGESAGQVVDRLALGLGAIMVPNGKAECPRCSCGGESRHAERVPAFVCQKCGALFRPVTSVERDTDKITTRFGDGQFETVYDDGMRIKGTSDPDET